MTNSITPLLDVEGDVVRRRSSFKDRALAPMGAGSLRGSVLALASTAFGSGVLALPWVYASMGLVLGSVLMAAGAFAAFASLRLLANASWAIEEEQYAQMVERSLGPSYRRFLDCVLVVYCGGAVCGYYVFIEQFGPLLMESLEAPEWLQDPTNLVLLLTAVPVLPLCLTRKISSLRYASLASTACLVLVALMLVAQAPSKHAEMLASRGGLEIWSPPATSWSLVPRAAAIFFFAFCCHINACATYSSMDNNKVPARVDKVISRAVLLMILVYGSVGVCGFISYGPACIVEVPTAAWPSCTPTNILASPRFSGPVSKLSRACMTLALCVSIPLNLHAARAILERWLMGIDALSPRKSEQSPLLMHVLTTVSILFSMLLVAIYYRNVNNILGVLGGFAAVSFMFVIPVLMMLKMHYQGKDKEAKHIGNWLGVSRSGIAFAAAFLVLCVVTGYYSAGVAVVDIASTAR